MPTETKRIIRETIVKYTVEQHTKLPVFVVNKMCKLNVDIGRHDWPHFYHDFLTDIMQVIAIVVYDQSGFRF